MFRKVLDLFLEPSRAASMLIKWEEAFRVRATTAGRATAAASAPSPPPIPAFPAPAEGAAGAPDAPGGTGTRKSWEEWLAFLGRSLQSGGATRFLGTIFLLILAWILVRITLSFLHVGADILLRFLLR